MSRPRDRGSMRPLGFPGALPSTERATTGRGAAWRQRFVNGTNRVPPRGFVVRRVHGHISADAILAGEILAGASACDDEFGPRVLAAFIGRIYRPHLSAASESSTKQNHTGCTSVAATSAACAVNSTASRWTIRPDAPTLKITEQELDGDGAMNVQVTSRPLPQAASQSKLATADCDIHPQRNSDKALHPYLEQRWI
ncbi:MAG TPA: hypothetical protein VGC09_00870, partial [Rhodopila sp.]